MSSWALGENGRCRSHSLSRGTFPTETGGWGGDVISKGPLFSFFYFQKTQVITLCLSQSCFFQRNEERKDVFPGLIIKTVRLEGYGESLHLHKVHTEARGEGLVYEQPTEGLHQRPGGPQSQDNPHLIYSHPHCWS